MRTALAFVLAAFLAACSHYDVPEMAAATIVSRDFRPGVGVIESVGVLRNARSGAVGSSKTAAEGDPHAYRLYLRMDGGFQTVDVDNAHFTAGQAVEVTADGRVLRIGADLLAK